MTTATSTHDGYLAQTRVYASPYIMGVIDAQQNRSRDPQQYDGDGYRAEYAQGYDDELRSMMTFGKDGEKR